MALALKPLLLGAGGAAAVGIAGAALFGGSGPNEGSPEGPAAGENRASSAPSLDEPRYFDRGELRLVADDSWVLTLHKTTEGGARQYYGSNRYNTWREYDHAWRYGPATMSVRLASLQCAPYVSDNQAPVELQEWDWQTAFWTQQFKELVSFKDLRKEGQKALDRIQSHREDVEVITRLLQNVQHYRYVDRRPDECGGEKPISEAARFAFEGARATSGFASDERARTAESEEMPAFSRTSEDSAMDRNHDLVQAWVWRFSPEDMAEARRIFTQRDVIAEAMNLKDPGLSPDDEWYESQVISIGHFHSTFRDGFLNALNTLSSLAWWLSPEDPGPGRWAEDASERRPLYTGRSVDNDMGYHHASSRPLYPYLHANAPLDLPRQINGDTLVRIVMPAFGFREDPGKFPEDSSYTGWTRISHIDGTQHRFLPGSPSTERVRVEKGDYDYPTWVYIHASGSGGAFSGRLTIRSSYDDVYENQETGDISTDRQNNVTTLDWRLEQGGDLWVPTPPVIQARIAVPDGQGGYRPSIEPLDYGDLFVVEGQLEEPARRSLYTLEINYGGNQGYDVVLTPTEEDRKLLRSDPLYIMWDVDQAQTAEGARQ